MNKRRRYKAKRRRRMVQSDAYRWFRYYVATSPRLIDLIPRAPLVALMRENLNENGTVPHAGDNA